MPEAAYFVRDRMEEVPERQRRVGPEHELHACIVELLRIREAPPVPPGRCNSVSLTRFFRNASH